MLICIVGPDGAGKSTLTSLLHQHLQDQSFMTHNVDRWDILNEQLVPPGKFIIRDLKQLRTCVAQMPINARFRFLTWAMSISLAYAQQNAGEAGILLFDSYWQKHAAVEIVYGTPKDTIAELTSSLPEPDVVFYLKIDPSITLERIRHNLVPYECGMNDTCSDASFLCHQKKVIDILDQWAKQQQWITLDADTSTQHLISLILKHLNLQQT